MNRRIVLSNPKFRKMLNKKRQIICHQVNNLSRKSNNNKKKRNVSFPIIHKFDRQNIVFGKITITMRYLVLNTNRSINENNSKTVNILNSDNHIDFDSFQDAINSLNTFIIKNNINYISYIDIIFGNGTTWVMPSNKRDLTGIGNAYSSETLLLNIGRNGTFIGRLGLFGVGQGTSTIRGSCTLNVYNLGALPIIDGLNSMETEDSLQFDNRLILNNLFWIGKIAINLYYPTTESDPVIAPIYNEPKDIFNKNVNTYVIKDSVQNMAPLNDWTLTRRPEVEIINVWVELEQMPVNTTGINKGQEIVSNVTLDTPLFFINTPAMSRFFMVQTNIMTYVMPKTIEIPVAFFSTQFLTPGVNDTFVQDCSFSTRAFGSSTPDYTCCVFYNNGKVSILDSQFNGALFCQCDKLALFGCYMLGVGVISSDPSGNPTTTPGLIMTPPSGRAAELASYPQKDARFIQSSCEWVSYINNWTLNNKNDVSGTIISNSINSEDNSFNKEQMILPWRFFINDNNWGDNPLAIFFNGSSFYMVDPKVGGDYTKGFTFDCITLTNTDTCSMNFNQTASLTGRLVIE